MWERGLLTLAPLRPGLPRAVLAHDGTPDWFHLFRPAAGVANTVTIW